MERAGGRNERLVPGRNRLQDLAGVTVLRRSAYPVAEFELARANQKGENMISCYQQIRILLGTILLFSSPAVAQESKQYIDVHVHLRGTTTSPMLGDTGGLRQPGSQGRAPRKARQTQQENLEVAAGNLIKKMNAYGVQQALVVVVPGPVSNEHEEESLRQVVMKHTDRLKLMAGGAILSPYLQDIKPENVTEDNRARFRQIATQLLRDGAVGFGEMLSYHLSMADHHSFKYVPPDHPLYLLLADIAAEHNVAIDLHMEAIVNRRPMPDNLQRASGRNPRTLEPTIPAFERLLGHNPKARIVWQHIGWDNTGDMTPELLDRLLSSHPNLYIALRVENRTQQVGNGPRRPNRLVDEEGKLKPEWLALIGKFADRVTIGSDEFFFPVESKGSGRPNQSFEKTWSLLDQFIPELAQTIGRDNARRIYGLK